MNEGKKFERYQTTYKELKQMNKMKPIIFSTPLSDYL